MKDNNRNKIEDMKSHLYDKEAGLSSHQIEGGLHSMGYKANPNWEREDKLDYQKQKEKMSKRKNHIFKNFFIGAIIFFVVAVGFAYFKFSNGVMTVSNSDIDIEVLGNAFTKGGDYLPLQIDVTNRNRADLELADLLVSYPSGADNKSTDLVRLPVINLGTIKSGQQLIRNIKVKLYGQEKSTRNVTITLQYHPTGSNAIFTKTKEYPVTISSAPLSLSVNAPDKEISDQEFTFSIKASLNTSLPNNTPSILQLSYPNNFVFESATPSASFSNNTWDLSNLSITNPVAITIKGRLVGQPGDEQIFHAYAGSVKSNNQSVVGVVYNSLVQSITISKPFLEADILVNNQDSTSYTASPGDSINASINWINNLSSLVTNAKVTVNLSGNVLDKNSIDPGDGFYDSTNNQIIWDQNSDSDLASIEPGGTGSLSFKFKTLSLIGDSNPVNNPEITIKVSISGDQPSLGTVSSINDFSSKTIKLLSDFQIASSAGYSSGPLPPKVGQETKYVVVWTLSNTSNMISGAVAKSILPVYVKWVGPLAGGNEDISYNLVTRQVTWNIGSVNSGVGLDSNREASFMVSLTPSTSQIGSIPQLMKSINLSGVDSFTNSPVTSNYGPITTTLSNDPNFKNGDQIVIQ